MAESQGYFTRCVVKDRNTSLPVTVEIVDREGTALRDIGKLILSSTIHSLLLTTLCSPPPPHADYDPSSIPASVTLQPDADRSCFNGTIVDDSIAAEFLEAFVLNITSTSPTARVLIDIQTTEINIFDDDCEAKIP